ncbi:hypothetical protein F1B92_04610 [Campylobacter sp. FMV-PI01]|uniref:Uncharacterized protein n=1 Tax=Campylobacter portucalensis TaxID=2608384 RepID=A0A6L5WGZ1_9BACT|nr:hypothetical protein [Campylobacter portucalensis]MSN96460.1 hypothetical protein [Campylobacter portucalensis]
MLSVQNMEIFKKGRKNMTTITINGLNIPTDETLNDLKNSKSLEKQYISHDDLINDIMSEIKTEQ